MQSLGWTVVRADADLVERVWRLRWGLPVCSLGRVYMPADVEARVLKLEDRLLGLATWAFEGDSAEVVTLDAFVEERGVGTRLLTAVEEACSGAGARRNRVFLTNDNLSALGFFLRRGYRLEQVHRDAVAALRQHKASIPATGRAGLPLVDLWELTKPLG